jgi:tRNA U54 and U55 pseudouridine synthase Pus10
MERNNRRKRELRIKEFNSRKRVDYKNLDLEYLTSDRLDTGTISLVDINNYTTTISGNSYLTTTSTGTFYNNYNSYAIYQETKLDVKKRISRLFLEEYHKRKQIELDNYETLKQMLDSELDCDAELACSIIDTYPEFE